MKRHAGHHSARTDATAQTELSTNGILSVPSYLRDVVIQGSVVMTGGARNSQK